MTWVYNSSTMERMIYRNGVKLDIASPILTTQLITNNNFRIGYLYNNLYNLYKSL